MSKSKNIFITSDVWFNRPLGQFACMTNEEYNNMVIDNWNNIIGKNDVVYILGGFGIGDCYDIVLKLNGEIHFLNSVFNHNDNIFRNSIKEGVENSVDSNIRKRIIFENNQILTIPEYDCVLSYFPLNDWLGKSTETFCFHGYTNKHNLKENNISCKFELWDGSLVNINVIKNDLYKFRKILSK